MSSEYAIYFCETTRQALSSQKDILFWRADIPDLKIISGSLEMEVGKAGKLTLQIPYNHPYRSKIHKKKTRFVVTRGGNPIWSGRVLDSEKTFYKHIQIVVEGALTYLLDTIQRPYTIDDLLTFANSYGAGTKIVRQSMHLLYLITNHNKECDADKKFDIEYVGNSNADRELLSNKKVPGNYSSKNFEPTKDRLNTAFIGTYGGFFMAKYDFKTHLNTLIYCGSEEGIKKPKTQAI